MTNINDLIQARYDAIVLGSGEAVPSSTSKQSIEIEVALALEKEDRDYIAEAHLRIDKVINGSRKVRRSHIKRNLEEILAASFPEDFDFIDPLLNMAFPLGDTAGLDKSLRFWTTEDFDALVFTALRSAVEITAAAAGLKETVALVKTRMATTHSTLFGASVAIKATA